MGGAQLHPACHLNYSRHPSPLQHPCRSSYVGHLHWCALLAACASQKPQEAAGEALRDSLEKVSGKAKNGNLEVKTQKWNNRGKMGESTRVLPPCTSGIRDTLLFSPIKKPLITARHRCVQDQEIQSRPWRHTAAASNHPDCSYTRCQLCPWIWNSW